MKFKMPSAEAMAAFDQFRRDRGEFVRTPEAELIRTVLIGRQRAFDQMWLDFLIRQGESDEAEHKWHQEQRARERARHLMKK